MGAAKCAIKGSDYIGVFGSATDKYVFFGYGVNQSICGMICNNLKVDPVELSVFGTDMVGLFVRGNSNGVLISSLVEDYEVERLKSMKLGINIAVIDSGLNAVGNNIIANDKLAIINPEYSHEAVRQIGDILGVEVIRYDVGGFKTVGANNILTNKGLVVNNRASDEQKEKLDKTSGFESTSTTANTGSLSIGLATISNSKGLIAGESTTGYELNRLVEGLDVGD